MRDDSLFQLPSRCEQFVPLFRFSFWFDRHHVASRPSLEAPGHFLHRRLAFGGDCPEKAACSEPQDAVRVCGQVIGKRVIAQKSSYLRIVDEEDFYLAEIEEVIAVFAVPIADVSIFLGEPSDFVLGHEQPQLIASRAACDGTLLGVDTYYP